MPPIPRLAAAFVLLSLVCAKVDKGHAQSVTATDIRAAALQYVQNTLTRSKDAQLIGPLIFDSRTLQARQSTGPDGWPESVALQWVGDIRTTSLPSAEVAALLNELNGSRGLVRWLSCGDAENDQPCAATDNSAVIALSDPWIANDTAQVLVLTWYDSTIKFHPRAWTANVLRLQRENGQWAVTGGHNWAGV